MAKKVSKAEAAARGTKVDAEAAKRKKRVKSQVKNDATGILVYVLATLAIVAFLFVLHLLGIG